MLVLNEGTAKELTLRVVTSSDEYGNEYFDSYETLDEQLAAIKRLVESGCQQHDGVERLIGIAIVPKTTYGIESGYGYDLRPDESVDSAG